MIISRGRNYIFVHMPKTGGTAMALALEDRAKKDDILIGDTPKAQRRKRRLKDVQTAGRLWKHSTLADIDGLVSADEFEAMCLFTLVRNPWDRMVSYYHWLQDQDFEHPAVNLAKSLTFNMFLKNATIASSIRENPARRYMTDVTGRQHDAHFIRIEHFDKDIAPVEDHLGFGLTLDVVNRSDRDRDYRSYYTEKTAAQVAIMAAEDIERFGYTFENAC